MTRARHSRPPCKLSLKSLLARQRHDLEARELGQPCQDCSCLWYWYGSYYEEYVQFLAIEFRTVPNNLPLLSQSQPKYKHQYILLLYKILILILYLV